MAYKTVNNSKDILNLQDGDIINKSLLFNLIVKSKQYGSPSYLGSDYEIKNTPQQGINWIGNDIIPKAVIIKSKSGNYFQDSKNEYAFKARNGKVNKYEKANQVLINQKKYGYPIMYFVEYYGNWKLLGRFKVIDIKDRSVVLTNFDKDLNSSTGNSEDASVERKRIHYDKESTQKNVSDNNKPHFVLIKKNNDWPRWELPTEEDNYQLAKILTKYVRFLLPDIVQRVVENNELIRKDICKKLDSKGINSELYMWEKCSCCFPGIRRYAGSVEISAFKKLSKIEKIEDAIVLDDNDYPKQIWSFIFRRSQFSKYGPDGYGLAHLVDHKKANNRMSEEFTFENNIFLEKPLYGLYTCASNSVFIPNNLIKPTDFNSSIRNLLFRKAKSLYGSFCNLVPQFIKFKENTDEKWNIENFEWAEPVGKTDNMNAFLEFRKNKLASLFGF